MSWKGIAIGGCLGSLFGGPVGALFGALLGGRIEKELSKGKTSRSNVGWSGASSEKREMIFLASAAAMLAKMAKADGVVTRAEINSVEDAFRRLGFSNAARTYAIGVFRRAKDDSHSIYEYASEFSSAVSSVEMRELFYELLWDLACADGVVTSGERSILCNLPRYLRIRLHWFDIFARERLHSGNGGFGGAERSTDGLAEAYQVLGVGQDSSDDEVRRAYREKAKRYHPDALRAQGLPEEMLGRATEMMAKVNSAWAEIRKARGL